MSSLSDDEEADLLFDNQSNASSSSGDDDNEPFPPPPLSQNYFAPPFYGRPPTPLPPSPSLTSLLRPSRPTTPDPSDDDIEPVQRASPKVPTYEYYGFVVYLFSSLTFLIYLLWAYLPSPFLHALGIYYYPNRWWALAIPSFITMLIVYIYVALALYNTEVLTLPLTSIETIVDEAAKIATVDSKGRIRLRGGGERKQMTEETARQLDWKSIWNKGTDAVMDVPLAGVCEVLYGGLSDEDEDTEQRYHGLHNDTLGLS
ncbi:PIG-P-domain-containing protein [Xylaria sp. FL0043]|nr:PIG-P-domain-containing protein [Xylaria sp. FL0043]